MASFFYLNLKRGAAIMDYGDLVWIFCQNIHLLMSKSLVKVSNTDAKVIIYIVPVERIFIFKYNSIITFNEKEIKLWRNYEHQGCGSG